MCAYNTQQQGYESYCDMLIFRTFSFFKKDLIRAQKGLADMKKKLVDMNKRLFFKLL